MRQLKLLPSRPGGVRLVEEPHGEQSELCLVGSSGLASLNVRRATQPRSA